MPQEYKPTKSTQIYAISLQQYYGPEPKPLKHYWLDSLRYVAAYTMTKFHLWQIFLCTFILSIPTIITLFGPPNAFLIIAMLMLKSYMEDDSAYENIQLSKTKSSIKN